MSLFYILLLGSSRRRFIDRLENSCMNVYDIAGNVWEWTLEHATSNSNIPPCTSRGGGYSYGGSDNPVSFRGSGITTYSVNNVGFRPTLY